MRARFIGSGDPKENAVCEVFGLAFPLDEWVEVPEPVEGKLRTNPTFETDGEASAPDDTPPYVPEPEPDPLAVLDHDQTEGAGGSVAVTSEKPFDEMTDDDLRMFIAARDGKPPHHMLGRTKLLALARKE